MDDCTVSTPSNLNLAKGFDIETECCLEYQVQWTSDNIKSV